MKIHQISRPPEAALARALADFELGFSYPLGGNLRFRISHGEDYACFYRAMGQCRVVVADHAGTVCGTLGGAVRRLRAPGGECVSALYIGDLKVLPGPGAGLTLMRLAAALAEWAQPLVTAAFGVAMEGTARTPAHYTGRAGLPPFAEVGKVMVLRIPCETATPQRSHPVCCDSDEGSAIFASLVSGDYSVCGGNPMERSIITPCWLRLESRAACGILEDTRKAKRLFEVGASEIRCAHLSQFAYRDANSGAQLLRAACARAADSGFAGLFCSVPIARSAALVDALGSPAPDLAPAALYATGFPAGFAWHLNSAEI